MKPNLPSTPKVNNSFPSGDAVKKVSSGDSPKQLTSGQKKARLEELKRCVVQVAEQNMDEAMRTLRHWLDDPKP